MNDDYLTPISKADAHGHSLAETNAGRMFDHNTSMLSIQADIVKEAVRSLHKLQPKIHKQHKETKSNTLPDCENNYSESLTKLKEAANKIIQYASPNPGSQSVEGGESSKCAECLQKQTEIWRLTVKLDSSTKEIYSLKSMLVETQKKSTKEIYSLKSMLEETQIKSTQEIDSLNRKLWEFKKSIDTVPVLITHVPKSDEKELKQKLDEEKTAKEDALKRLCPIALDTPPENNPYVMDLSDVNRPTKLGEKMSELYDNEWTAAFDELQHHLSERDVIQKLLDVLKAVFDHCKDISTANYFEKVQICIEQSKYDPDVIKHTHVELSDSFKQQIKDFRRFKAVQTSPHIQELLHKRIPLLNEHHLQSPKMKVYINKCIELCWLMVVQDPPMFLRTDVLSTFDSSMFRDYTCRGDFVEYLVWPTTFLYEGGTVLVKGVAQGCTEPMN